MHAEAAEFRCPNCRHSLTGSDASGTLRCDNSHTFDIAREGYVNLLLAQNKRSKNPGDSDIMIKSRQRFLGAGFYESLGQGLAEIINQDCENTPFNVLDIGCGEGYYLQQLSATSTQSNLQLAGVDIAKTAVRLAAKRNLAAQLAVASAYDIPFFANSFDVALSVFSPLCPMETARVLKPKGTLIMVGPGANHLNGLTDKIYTEHQPHRGNFRTVDDSKNFTLRTQLNICEEICVTGTHIQDLLAMTPYYWHTQPEQQAALAELGQLSTTIDFDIRIYRIQ